MYFGISIHIKLLFGRRTLTSLLGIESCFEYVIYGHLAYRLRFLLALQGSVCGGVFGLYALPICFCTCDDTIPAVQYIISSRMCTISGLGAESL